MKFRFDEQKSRIFDCQYPLQSIHFDTRIGKWISVLPSFEMSTCVMYKFTRPTCVFNKVVRWD